MSKQFLADPVTLRSEGKKEIDQSGQFDQNVKDIYSTLDQMLTSDYLSPAARAIGNAIRSKKEQLDLMTKTIREYGEYCVTSANTVDANEQNIIDNYTTKK